jgi:hypothetical protein
MEQLHAAIAAAVRKLPATDWTRKAPVVYGEGQAPYPTCAEDIVGWLRDHYREHVTQCADLINEWSVPQNPG